jgi:hypothetical protein
MATQDIIAVEKKTLLDFLFMSILLLNQKFLAKKICWKDSTRVSVERGKLVATSSWSPPLPLLRAEVPHALVPLSP